MSTPSGQYATDVTDAQWRRIEPLLPAPTWQPNGPGRPPRDRRQIVNGLLYLTKTGCPWALLPPCFGPWKTVYDYFRRWSLQGVWPQVLDRTVRVGRRGIAARSSTADSPSVGAYKGSGRRYWIDSPSGNAAGTDGGRRRRLAVSIVRRSRRQPMVKQPVMTPAKRSRGVSVICWSTPWACLDRWWSPPPI